MDTMTNKAAQSIDEFCVSHGISRAMFYKILSQGRGPRVMKVGTRTLISGRICCSLAPSVRSAGTRPGKGRT